MDAKREDKMKTKQEQIEEMASDICPIHGDCKTCPVNTPCTYLQSARIFYSFEDIILKQIYNEGYRKASDVIDEFVERLKAKESPDLLAWEYGEGYLDCIKTAEQLADEMKKEVEK